MINPLYQVNISYYPSYVAGHTHSYIAGVTSSFPTYSSPYFVASMPEISMSATGSDYRSALDNLLVSVTASNIQNTGYPPYSTIRTW
jgi:hypothetical protein